MMKCVLKQAVAVLAAAATTFGLFSAVASLADSERATMLAAQIAPKTMAVYTGAWTHR
jgi:hypothetical protein